MSRSDGSVSNWLRRLQAGEAQAAGPLWERYFQRLVQLARAKLARSPRGPADEEDVALSAFDSLCRGLAQGRFPNLSNRDSLWRLLVVLTARKAAHLKRDATRQKRGGDRAAADDLDVDRLLAEEPTPQFVAQVAEEYDRLLALLGDSDLRSVALWKMEGYGNEEIAEKLGCGLRSVGRKLRLIRKVWTEEASPGESA